MVTTEQIRASWDEIASGYDRFVTSTHMWLGNQALRRAGLQAGMRLLDVACGSGALSIPAARLGAEVLAVDMSPVMVDRITARGREEGLANLQARVMDGQALELDDDSFDIAASQYGVMLFPDMPRGIREMARVTRPGGTVLMVAYANPENVEFITFTLKAIAAVAPDYNPLTGDEPPLPFQLRDPERLRKELTDAGLVDVRVETITENLEFRSGDEMWSWLANSNPIGKQIVAGLTEEQAAAVRAELDGLLRERSGGNEAAILKCAVNIGTGTKR